MIAGSLTATVLVLKRGFPATNSIRVRNVSTLLSKPCCETEMWIGSSGATVAGIAFARAPRSLRRIVSICDLSFAVAPFDENIAFLIRVAYLSVPSSKSLRVFRALVKGPSIVDSAVIAELEFVIIISIASIVMSGFAGS